ncbi:MFS general substrate transporter [Pluteus cervinus]|uniref:MFS general substrate transporter n=1 Tax=Pluteus cervinus TaxID=181527 RepID=A0ACD3B402_9AGAR|nr:MFS general substrate transporter [Pluteus cervinus]
MAAAAPDNVFSSNSNIDYPEKGSSTTSKAQESVKTIAESENGYEEGGNHLDSAAHRAKLEKQLLRKLDLRMIMLVVIFILNYMDRSNVAVARLAGLEKDLGLKGNQYSTVLSIFIVGYILMMVPSNLFLNYLKRPSLYLPTCTIVWGILSVLTGFTQNYSGVLACRFFLGFVESTFFPGALLTLSAWYKQEELGVRNCILFCGILISTAFGTLIATGILGAMDGKLGYAAWRWLFFIEGAMTAVLAIPAYFIIPDFPNTPSVSTWLTPEEIELVRIRKEEDLSMDLDSVPDSVTTYGIQGLILAVKDLKVWWLGLSMGLFQFMAGFHQFFPTLAATLGYNRTITLLLCSPPSILGAVIAFMISRQSDKSRQRFRYIALPLSLGIIGFIMSLTTMNTAVRYTALFFMEMTGGGWVILLAWTFNSFPQPASKRAVALGLTAACSQVGQIGGSYLFPVQWGPSYNNSYIISLGVAAFNIVLCYGYYLYLKKLNRRLDVEDEKVGHAEAKRFRYLL